MGIYTLFFLQTDKVGGCSKLCSGEGKQEFRTEGGEEGRELRESKLILLLVAVGYVVGLGNVWCFCTEAEVWRWLVAKGS